jgi:hypothetical protein
VQEQKQCPVLLQSQLSLIFFSETAVPQMKGLLDHVYHILPENKKNHTYHMDEMGILTVTAKYTLKIKTEDSSTTML